MFEKSIYDFRTIHFPGMKLGLFVAQFVAKYDSSAIKANLMKELYARTQGPYEDVYSFIVNKWSLFTRLRPETPLRERLQTIQELLLPRVRAITRGTTFDSLQHLLEITTQIETDLREEQHRLKPPLQQMRREADAERRSPSARPVPDRPPPMRPPNPCHFCSGDHFNKDCPQRSGNATRAAPPASARLAHSRPDPGRASQLSNLPRAREPSSQRPQGTTSDQ